MSEAGQEPSQNNWEAMYQGAVELHGSGKMAEAAPLFAAIIEHNPAHFPSLHRLAAIRRHEGKFEESVALLKQAIGCNPSSADATTVSATRSIL